MKKNKTQKLQLTSSIITLLFSLGICSNNIVNASEATIQITSSKQQIAQLSKASEKVRVAVLDFDFSAVSDPIYLSYFNGGARGVSDILVNQLVKSGNYTVVERSKLDAILEEQNLGDSGRVDASTAAEIGRLLGVEAVVIGSVTQMDLQRQEKGGNLGGFFGAGADVTDVDAYVKLSVRMINTTTGEILTVAEGDGNASQSDTNVSVFGISGGSSTDNEGKLITLAAEQAIEQVVTSMSSSSGDLAAASADSKPSVDAVVADVTGNLVILNKGLADGYREGMKVSIERVSKEIKDPTTGEVIRRLTEKIGEIELTDVDEKSSVGQVISGANFQVGDMAIAAE
jgi:curli biogenesis system outer membrane secretion channel CsgG